MLANILGIEFTNGTLTFPAALGIPALGIVVMTGFIFSIAKPFLRYRRTIKETEAKMRADERRAQSAIRAKFDADFEQSRIEEKQKEKQEVEQLLPQPWLQAYQDCEKLGTWRLKHAWFKEWLERRTGQRGRTANPGLITNSLPQLSTEAVDKIANMTSYNDNDKKYMMGRLSPYMILQDEPSPVWIEEETANENRMAEIKMKPFVGMINALGIKDPDVIKQMKKFIRDVGMNTYGHQPGCNVADCHCLQDRAMDILNQMP